MKERIQKVKLEEVGLNSLRTYYNEKWHGTIVDSLEEANEYIANFVKNTTEAKVLERLKRGSFFLLFLHNYEPKTYIKEIYEELPGIRFKLHSVDNSVATVFLSINTRNLKPDFVSAELKGFEVLLRKIGFDRKHIPGWMRSRVPNKIICVEEVKTVLEDENLTKAFLNYNPYFTQQEYLSWKEQYGIKQPIKKYLRNLISQVVVDIFKK